MRIEAPIPKIAKQLLFFFDKKDVKIWRLLEFIIKKNLVRPFTQGRRPSALNIKLPPPPGLKHVAYGRHVCVHWWHIYVNRRRICFHVRHFFLPEVVPTFSIF